MQHERRPSSQSMQSELSNQGMNPNMNRNFQPQGRGRGGYGPNQQFMGSPGPNFRPSPSQPGRQMPSNFQQGGAPGSPFNRPAARASPSPMPAQPNMSQGPQMHYGGYNQHHPQHNQVNPPFLSVISSTSRTAPASPMRNVSSSSSQANGSVEQHAAVDSNRSPLLFKSSEVVKSQCLTTPKSQGMYGMPQFDPASGYYQPYQGYYGGYNGQQQTPQSPRPNYPSPFPGTPGHGMAPPFNPPGTPMQRSGSQVSERPASSLGHPSTPAHNPIAPSHTPVNHAQAGPSSASSSFVRPVKKSNAIKITDASGNAVSFAKPSPSSSNAQPQTPVIVSTPNAPTPPPRAPSTPHNRAENKTTKSTEETKNAFAEQVKRQVEENKRKEEAEAAAKAKQDVDAQAKAKQIAEDEAAAEAKKIQTAADAEAEKIAAKAAEDKKAADDKKAEEDAAAAASKKSEESEEEEKKRKQEEEDARFEAEIAEMEAREKEEEERERAYNEKRAKEKAEKEKQRLANEDVELKRQEREAEAREEARERERKGETSATGGEPDEEAKALFKSLKKPTLGPGAEGGDDAVSSDALPEHAPEQDSPVATAVPARIGGQAKVKPAHLKLETNKSVERAEPTPGMQALKSARFLELKEEAKYPDGFKSPNPALNQSQRTQGRAYDRDFLLQFQPVFKEKPSVDWDQKVRDTLGPGDEPSSARSARTPSGMTSRQPSRGSGAFPGGNMGQFAGPMGGGRTLPPNTTSDQRFQASSGLGGRSASSGMGSRAPSNLGMGIGGAPGAAIGRQNSSLQSNSPRQGSSRGGRGGRGGGDRSGSTRGGNAANMPLTAHMEIAPLEKSKTGWQPPSVAGPPPGASSGLDASGMMAPDMVQRKVKAALNKMTPEKFDKIADQILDIAAQSKNETDGRTLRQVIQLTFEKACDEAHWAGMYAKFCSKMLTAMSVDIRDETIKDKAGNAVVGGALFRKYLLNRCQEEFERGWQANLPDKPEGEEQEAALLSDEYYVAAAAKRRGLGLIQFIGQLYKLKMLTLRIMHECVMRLLNFEGDPDESAIENLVTLLKSVGGSMEEEEAGRGLLNTYFQRIDEVILKNAKLASRPRFMVMDLIDLRKAGWKGKDDAKGPKTITQIHDEAAAAQAKAEAERSRTSQRGGGGGGRMGQGRGDARNFSGGGMPPPVDYNRTTVGMDDLRKLQNRGSNRPASGVLGPGGGLGPGGLGPRAGSRRGAGIGPGSGNPSRTGTPPVDGKKEEPSTAQNAFR